MGLAASVRATRVLCPNAGAEQLHLGGSAAMTVVMVDREGLVTEFPPLQPGALGPEDGKAWQAGLSSAVRLYVCAPQCAEGS